MNELFITTVAAISVTLFFYVIFSKYSAVSASQIHDFESESNSPLILLLKEIINPLASLIAKHQDAPSLAKEILQYKRLLLSAGNFAGLNPCEIYALKILIPALFAIFALPVSMLLPFDPELSFLCVILFCFLLYFYPGAALREKARKRRELFLRQLPGGLDILKIAADAGLDFQKSIHYLVEIYLPGPVKDEFNIFLREIKLGIPATEALTNISHRINLPEVSSVFISLSQAMEMGTSISEMLADTVAEIRKKRILSAETEAQKTVVKITFPLLFLILPGIFIVLLAPMAKPIIEAFSGF